MAEAKLKSKLKVKKSEQVNESVKSIGDIVSPRLPKVTIPSFDSNPLRWPIFYATFKSLVHENIKLDSISKLHYLLGSLTHNALALCSGVPPTPENYSIMWDSLIDKYQDSRQIAFVYLDQILKFKPFLVESGQNLNLFVEKFDSAVNALKEVKVGELSDFILMTIALQKLDVHTQKLFEQSLAKGVIPTYNELSVFIKTQAKILSRTSGSANSSKQANSKAVMHSFAISADSNSSDVMSNNTYEKLICPKCKGDHTLFKCHKFMSLTPTERVHVVKAHNLCFNCLHSNHGVKNCSSNSSCRKCSKRHHTLLHFHHKSDANGKDNSEVLKGNPSTSSVSVESKPSPPVSLCSTSELVQSKYTVLLATAQVHVASHFGENFLFRFLIDSASQCNFITQRCCQRLKLPVNRACLTVSGIGVSEKRVNGQAQLNFYSKYDIHNKYTMDVLIVDKITDQLPTCVIDSEVCDTFKNLRLADDEFYRPSEIDGMIGAELVPYILKGLRITGPDSPVALDSTLGFIIMGKAKAEVTNNIIQSYCCVNSPLNMDQLIQQFWDIEEVPNSTVLNADDLECEKLFAASVKRDVSGRYEVALPFKRIFSDLGDSYTSALRRFQNLEKRFASMPLFKKQYMEVIRDYFDQGHLKTISGLHPKSCGYFIPHHGVFKASSSSTPLRVVFDASAKTDNGISLNDALYIGPKLQTDIFDILLNFRLFQFAMTSDVKQMFSAEEPIQICQLTTVAFGVKSSPYLALRTLRQLANDEAKKFPLASEIILRDIYIDDIICSVAEKSIAHNIYREFVGLFRAGGMELVKWATNLRELSDEIPDHARSNQILEFPTEFLKDNIIRVGGRLVNAVIAYDQQHPMLLPKRDHFVDLLIDYNHRFNLHARPHLLLSVLRQKYWILAARGTVRVRVQKCNTCFKTKPRSHAPIMADLPSVRVSQAKAFTYTGVDYGGPFYITLSRHRGVRSQKAYICLFTCLTTRAVHLELASDLSTDVFLAAFKRFLSRRGPCSTIYSDSGTNFIGAKRYLNELYEFVQSNLYQSAVNSELSCRRIIWRLNPPTGSHFGGAWESMI
ncbi:uncharacterized protein LOC123301344 [Chrysoperla carnea]|uniref:uncharacterized protein LOC123301344 n=1 Tax=Chrysoperla carnea TaxID=189513 RepID=UPI001D090D7C|nr:uncharacterized protein LOC123301344 [Chrysoperla carnea]